MERPRCSVYLGVSLDGMIARPDGGLDFLDRVQAPGEDYGYKAFFATIDALVIGRRTYETVLAFPSWPYEDKRVVVMARGPSPEPTHGEAITAEEPRALVERLGREGVGRIYVDGGALVRSFLRAGLVDDLTLSIVPVVLGDGIPLFERGLPQADLELEESRAFPSGLVQVRYRVARAEGAVAVRDREARA